MTTTTRDICGTDKGYRAHTYRHEKACKPCLAHRKERRNVQAGTRPFVTIKEVVEEIEWLISLGQGTHYIIQALGYMGKEASLERRLYRYGRQDLAKRLIRPELEAA